jgi:hypothetical protein
MARESKHEATGVAPVFEFHPDGIESVKHQLVSSTAFCLTDTFAKAFVAPFARANDAHQALIKKHALIVIFTMKWQTLLENVAMYPKLRKETEVEHHGRRWRGADGNEIREVLKRLRATIILFSRRYRNWIGLIDVATVLLLEAAREYRSSKKVGRCYKNPYTYIIMLGTEVTKLYEMTSTFANRLRALDADLSPAAPTIPLVAMGSVDDFSEEEVLTVVGNTMSEVAKYLHGILESRRDFKRHGQMIEICSYS